MKKGKYLFYTGMLSILMFVLNGCEKYDEGGFIFKTEKKLKANTWKLSKYLVDGVDVTNSILISNYEENYEPNYSRTYIDKKGEVNNEIGNWTFDKSNKKIKISGVSSIDITDKSGSISSSYFNILKLDKDEFWYYFENGSEKHEFHFIKK